MRYSFSGSLWAKTIGELTSPVLLNSLKYMPSLEATAKALLRLLARRANRAIVGLYSVPSRQMANKMPAPTTTA